ncbi:NACHT and WD domain protein [Xylaria bambusicola]|uniref:NACHT and WD domain protein n=1 Tax=Xylaria bambusicola TaxID=326684 RepID=UPI0020085239|nr:NACHT and WD domain protein [Xylaria bambusicola]KAI0515458.1 NACHT and WD domain protein [Xylaria bambusicola]
MIKSPIREVHMIMAKHNRKPSGSQEQGLKDPLSHDISLKGSISGVSLEASGQGDSTTLTPTLPSSTISSSHGIQSPGLRESEPGPLGLNVVYTPENARKLDIVFVHGLGGTSRWTWSKNKNPALFWPSTFLPLEPDLCLARILTFGYNANFLKTGSLGTSILDFAKALLFDLKYGKDESKSDLNMGSVPLIFVVHSMGGLVAKEAYLLGQNDPEYEAIVRAISSIVFLATPHRGTNLAETLNRILQAAIVTNPKPYVSELIRNSFTLQRLNEQFRHVAPRLDIVSFYETQPTSLGLKSARIMIVEKDSAVLGYPGEISKALEADHHGVSKFDHPLDPNYITVRNVLMSLTSKALSEKALKSLEASDRKDLETARSFLGLQELPEADYTFSHDQWMQGTCDWIIHEKAFNTWLDTKSSASGVLWLNGNPASGKSVMSSFIINHLIEQKLCCQYFYIRFGDRTKRTLSLLLRSIAFQIAQADSKFLREIIDLKEEGIDMENAEHRMIWQRVYKSILFKSGDTPPLYWVIDGLDEAENPQAILRALYDLSSSLNPVRVLITSRKTLELAAAVTKIPHDLYYGEISVEGHVDDLRCYVTQELTMLGTPEFKQNVTARILEGAHNNFLWVRLAVEKLNACHRLADVELALQQLPGGMGALYARMVSSMPEDPINNALAHRILKCAVGALRTLTVVELLEVIGEDTTEFLDIQKSVMNLCGGLVVVDNDGNVSMVHQTAREYLLDSNNGSLCVEKNLAHGELFLSCMKCLTTAGLREKLIRRLKPDLLDYAASFWSSHLISSDSDSIVLSETLRRFLKSPAILSWIHFLTLEGKLHILVLTSKHLSIHASRQQKRARTKGEESHQNMDRALIENWAVDLIKLTGKFGAVLTNNPESIYKEIPPLCPRNSSIYQQFGSMEAKSLRVLGISTDDWDDSLSRLSLPGAKQASFIAAAGAHIAMLAVSGNVFIYDSSTFEETSMNPINHHERVYRMELDRTASLLVTYGYRTTKIWELPDGKCRLSVNNLAARPRPLTMLLTNNNKTLLVGFDDRRIRSINICETVPNWKVVADLEEPELDGQFLNAANYMTLSNDGSLVAVAYRGHPLAAWELDGPIHLGHCWRKREEVSRGEVIDAVWNPQSAEVLGLYLEGVVFKWQPYEDYVDELHIGASKLAISDDGNTFAAGSAQGVVKLYKTSNLALVYQLASQDTVLGLAFSPDCRRFYDIRGHYGNVWEPEILMRYAEQANRGFGDNDDIESAVATSSMTAMRTYQQVDNITVLSNRGRIATLHTSRGHLSIEKLAWSPAGCSIAFIDSSKKLFIIPINPPDKNNIDPVIGSTTEISLKSATKGEIYQILLHPDSNHIFVFTSTIIHRSITLDSIEAHWILNPLNDSQILGFDPQSEWNAGEPTDQGDSRSEQGSTIDRISRKNQAAKKKIHYHFDTASLGAIGSETLASEHAAGRGAVRVATLPEALSTQITDVLAFLPQNRLVYLSRSNSICSWKILSWAGKSLARAVPMTVSRPASIMSSRKNSQSIDGSPIKQLFSLPSDWVSKDCLALSTVWIAERSYLCPKNGEVAIVRCAALV